MIAAFQNSVIRFSGEGKHLMRLQIFSLSGFLNNDNNNSINNDDDDVDDEDDDDDHTYYTKLKRHPFIKVDLKCDIRKTR